VNLEYLGLKNFRSVGGGRLFSLEWNRGGSENRGM